MVLKLIATLFAGKLRVSQFREPARPQIEERKMQHVFRRSRRRAYAAAYAAEPHRFAPPKDTPLDTRFMSEGRH